MNLKSTLFVAALALTAVAARGQDIFIYPADGSEAVQTPIEEVRKFTFEASNLVLYKVDGNTGTFAIGGIRKITFKTDQTGNGLADPTAGFEVKLYPQDGQFAVESSDALGQVRVFSITGVQMYSVKSDAAQVTLPTSNYPAGVYLVRVESDKGAVTKKFIVK